MGCVCILISQNTRLAQNPSFIPEFIGFLIEKNREQDPEMDSDVAGH